MTEKRHEMKKRVLILITLMVLILVACKEEPVVESKTIIKNVRVEAIEEKVYQDYERYVGHITSTGMVKRSFEVAGRIQSIDISVGALVEEGQLLATIDTEGLQFALDAAKAEYSASNAQYQKSLESYNYAEDLLNNTSVLYDQGVSSKNELDQVRLNYNVSRSEVNSAREVRNQTSTNVDVKEYAIKQSQIFALKAGKVVDILLEAGELVGSGYPVMVLRNPKPVVSFGISQSDLQFVDIDSEVTVIYNGIELFVYIIGINQTPDSSTQTYEIEVAIDKDLPLGSIVSVDVPTVTVEGSKIPLGAIRSDGEDFVYIISDGQASRVNIKVLAIFNQEVVVEGLPELSTLVVEGILGLTAGDTVNIVED